MLAAVAVGGAIGSVARHLVNQLAHAVWLSSRFPPGTAIVNLSGCVIIGLLAGLIAADRLTLPAPWREFVFVGLLGGFTTFSSFGLDTFLLARTQPPVDALLNVAVHVVGGMLAVWVGYQIGVARS
jgi:CrcB protein